MAVKISSVRRRPVPNTTMQQSVLQQAQAAATAQTDPTRPMRQEALLRNTDLTAPDPGEGYIPPPAYGDVYGEIRNEKDGLSTSALVTDHGRVEIRINQLNRRLSQILTPALRQQIASVQNSDPPPPPYIPPSLGRREGVTPPPSLNVVIQVVGSHGDVQPFVALGKVLKDTYGHRVRLATHPNFKNFVQENGLEFFSIGGDPSVLMSWMVQNPSLIPGFRTLFNGDVGQRRKEVGEYIQGCWRSCYEAGDGLRPRTTVDDLSEHSGVDPDLDATARPFVADCIIANPPSFAHIHCAEKLGIPLHIMFTMPYSPTQAFPHPLANIKSTNADPQLTNFISYAMIELLTWQGVGDIINRFRKKCLKLDPVSVIWAPGMLQRLKIPYTYCWSPALIPKPKDWGPHISISGFYFLNSSNYIPAPDLQAFLDDGPAPVYIGFGSIVLDDPKAMTELIFEAVRKTGQRVLLSKGWAAIGAENIPHDVFMLDSVPHDWLFKQVSCVVHHGGAGTTAAGIAAGRPTVVVPFFGDQPFWGAIVARAGAGPDPIPIKRLTSDNLADAINFCLKPKSLERARELASKIAAERGTDTGAQSFHQYLEADRLRCILAPSRPATWRIKRTKIRLSAFAACTLANANRLDFHNLELFRPQEHYTDEGPWDPVSGGFAAAMRALGGMAMGLADIPSETWKAFHIPSGPSRQQSQASVSTAASKGEASHTGETSPPTSPERSQTSLNVQETFPPLRSPSRLSSQSSLTPNIESIRISDGETSIAGRGQVRNRVECNPSNDHDMLRRTGVHTSRGLGRIVRATVQSPMEISVGLNQGFHNLPKLWGDDTVRPLERVSDLKSGLSAAGREFGFGMYDGISGLFTQPWKGAQKEGTSGFFKGFGKGIGGFATKPTAALCGIASLTMKGVHKEIQNLFGSSVQSYIVASRLAQGYEEWLQSSDVEKEDVVARWRRIEKQSKKGFNPDEIVRDALEAQRKKQIGDRVAQENHGLTARSAQFANGANAATENNESETLVMAGSQSLANTTSEEPLEAAEINETIRLSVQETSRGDVEEDADVFRAIQESVSQFRQQRQESADHQAAQEKLRLAMAASEAEAQQKHVSEASAYQKQLKRVIAQSLREQRQWGQPNISSPNYEEDVEFEQATAISELVAEVPAAVTAGSSRLQRPPPYDPGHLGGTTQDEFEMQQKGQRGEKTTQEKTEEEIVLEYIKKQSLLEAHHQNKGKGRVTATEDENDEDLQKALKLSMQGHGV